MYGILGRFTSYDFTAEVLWDESLGVLAPSALNYVAFLMSGEKCPVGVAWSGGVTARSCMAGIMISYDNGASFEPPSAVDTGAVAIFSSELICATSKNHVTTLQLPSRKAVTTRVDVEGLEPTAKLTLRGMCLLAKSSSV